mmetsp:Transcript_64997/g.188435  ORF Transcript_64997/g.188435 Transcript_64997/m.188435 type:complete len:213 (+) Transcript_64997:534-1172(+)
MLDLTLEQVGVGFVSPFFSALEQGLEALGHPQHVHVLGALLKICSLHLQHFVLPLDQAQLLPELFYGLQCGHLLLSQLQDAVVPRFDDIVADHDGVGIVRDNRRLRHLDLALLQLEQDLDVVLLPPHEVHVLLQLLFQLPVRLRRHIPLALEVRMQALHLLEFRGAVLDLDLRREPLPPQLQHALEAGLVDAFGTFQRNVLLLRHGVRGRRL